MGRIWTGDQWFYRCILTAAVAGGTLVLLGPLLAFKVLEGIALALKTSKESVEQVWRRPEA